MSRRKQRSAFDQVSELDRGRIVVYRDCGLSFREISSRVGRNQTTVMRICDRWMQEGTTDRRGRSHLSSSVHHFTVCGYHSTPFTAEWSVRKTSIAWSTLDAEPQTSPPSMTPWREDAEQLRYAPAPDIMVWGGIGYHSRTSLVRIAGTLSNQRYISEVLQLVALLYLQGLATAIFQQDNARKHVARIVQRFFVNHQIELLPWPACSPDL
ncbi:transposable element Tcb1 transposase [Trichonephila clavipes]|nr:transposable element Tcb1 transposase [Trichonephila clavipes]